MLIATAAAVAQQGFSTAPSALLQAAGAPDSANVSGVTILNEDTTVKVDASNRLTQRFHLVYRIDTADAVEGWSSVGIHWSPWYQNKPAVHARVVTPDGAEHELDQKTLTDTPANDQRPEIYDNERIVSGPLPAVKVGAIVEEEEILEDAKPFFAAGVTRRYWFARRSPVQNHRLVIEAPASLPLKYGVISGPKITVRKEQQGDLVRLTFEQGPIAAFDEYPANLPSDVSPWPYVVISTAPSWKEVAAAYSDVVEKQIASADMKAIAAKHKGGTTAATITNLLAYLHSEVRYTGVEFDEASLVPRAPADVFKSKFGDCKDKAAVLVALLRAAGVPAHVALLSTGPGLDLDPDYPGFGNFDHAIVYVPASAGSPERWIDATAEFHSLGALPYMDEGRLALVAASDTASLHKTPESKPADNLLVEHRDFVLQSYGKAKITETSETHGALDAVYRESYGTGESKETRQNLDRYVQNEYLGDSLSRFEHGDGADLRTPFHIRLEVAKGRRGFTDSDSAVVAIRYESLFSRFTDYLKSSDEDDKEREGEHVVEKKAPRTEDVVFQPFITEWRYTITLPAGYRSRALPSDRTQQIGPALLTVHFENQPDGKVSGVVRLDSVKGRYTPAEAQATRKAYKELVNGDPLLLNFEEIGVAELAAGRVREALAAERQNVAQHPGAANAHVHLARTLLEAGLADLARDEARAAIKLDPKSAIAYRALGWILQHDLIGRRFKKGFDYAGAIAAYRKAEELDPSDTAIRAELAILCEYDANGEHYSPAAKLDDAVAEYRAIAKIDENTGHAYDDNLLITLTYAHRFREAAELLPNLPQTKVRLALQLVNIAATEGAQAAITQSNTLARESTLRRPALSMAGITLRDMRMYPLAADLLAASAEGDANAAQLLGQVQAFRATSKHEELIDRKNPASAVQRLFTIFLDPAAVTPETVKEFEYVLEVPDNRKSETLLRMGGTLRGIFERASIPRAVAGDLLISNMHMTPEGDDAHGYRIRVQPMGTKPIVALVAHYPGGYKLLGFDNDVTGVGVEALRLLQAGDLQGARQWLDWVREEISIPGGDDPYVWPAFPRLYTRGDPADAAKLRRAALSLIADTEYAKPYLAELKQMVAQASDAERPLVQTLLAAAYKANRQWADLQPVAAGLLQLRPDSDFALSMLGDACTYTKDYKVWEAAIAKRLERIPDDPIAIRARATMYAFQGQFGQSRAALKSLLDAGRATESDMNLFGWNALFTGKVQDSDIDIVQRASSLSQNSNYATVHTLACLYAEVGKTKEARELLLHTIDIGGLEEPDSQVWYGLGRVAEYYGERDAALKAYHHMEEREEEKGYPNSTWALGQMRLRTLQDVASAGTAKPAR